MSTDIDAIAKLYDYRKSIDNFDAALIHILAERFRVTKAVGVPRNFSNSSFAK